MSEAKYASTTEAFIHDDTNGGIVLAPHAGEMEIGTGIQAQTIVSEFEHWSAWMYGAEADGGSTFDTFHTRSTEIKPSEYMYLTEVLEHSFERAIAFHGFAPSGTDIDIYIGGRLPVGRRQQLAERIQSETGFETAAAQRGDQQLWRRYKGTHTQNILNRVIHAGSQESVQLEQRREPREESPRVIARIVADYFG